MLGYAWEAEAWFSLSLFVVRLCVSVCVWFSLSLRRVQRVGFFYSSSCLDLEGS